MAVASPPPPSTANAPVARLLRHSDMLLAALLILIIAMLIVPLPEFLLDTMLVINITGATTVLLVALYNTEPLQFSVFPSLLLVMTLFRLSLNVAATKLILSNGHAGAVIEAFGKVRHQRQLHRGYHRVFDPGRRPVRGYHERRGARR